MSAVSKPSRRDWLLAAAVIVAAVLYFPLNRATGHEHVLTTSLDGRIPLIPAFAVPYIALLPVFWLIVLSAFVTGRDFVALALVIAVVFGISDLIFLVYPTYVPRPQHVTGFLSGAVRYVYAHDQPYNDLPSGHAASAVILALYAWRGRVAIRILALLFGAAVIAATVLIKQHSIAGASGGAGLALIAWFGLAPSRRLLTRPQARVKKDRLNSDR